MREELHDDDFDEDQETLRFMNWYADLEALARPFSISVADRDAWYDAFEQGMSPLAALADDYPEVMSPPTAHIHPLTAEAVAVAIDFPLAEWPGNCYGVACAVLNAGLVEGRPVYGHYLGRIAAGSIFEGKPLVHHGWIETTDGKVIDPTRWVFECAEPYLFQVEAKHASDYDEGGNQYRLKACKPAPEHNPQEQLFTLDEGVVTMISGMLGRPAPQPQICLSELFWLANLSLLSLKDWAEPLYHEINRLGMLSLVPVDNKWKILGVPATSQGHC